VENLNKRKSKKGSIGLTQLLDENLKELTKIKWVKVNQKPKKTDPILVSAGKTYYIRISQWNDHQAEYSLMVIHSL